MESMHNVYNPLSEYVLGVSIGSALFGINGMSFGTATVAEKSSACIKDITEMVVIEKETDPKKLALACGESFVSEGNSSVLGKVSNYLSEILLSYKQKQ
ncbi:hypothetical protein GM31_06390 [Trabulsiella odontotermitis]|uniref:Uncharacterized protein n=2 Tax=Trabulsiella odontotermitis TaxID=379893 RepID=A0A0L0GLQ3_9ENTR|nr:hypothetical protein GM31_06390 [Trabulsiella odontotermitis]KNC89819.1 hypothetical protein GM30_05460 [Trabulsiella odontotermitis]